MKRIFASVLLLAMLVSVSLMGTGCSDELLNDFLSETQSEKTTTNAQADSNATTGEKNALKSANSYLNYSSFSAEGLKSQLEFEGYTAEEAKYAVDHCGANWNEQAVKSAKSYLNYSAFSRKGLIGQLEYEKFTTKEATYGADHCEADWKEQAVKCAKEYLEYSSFSKKQLIEQLEYEGFTHEEAVYGVEENGYR